MNWKEYLTDAEFALLEGMDARIAHERKERRTLHNRARRRMYVAKAKHTQGEAA